MRVAVVIPTYDEAENIGELVRSLSEIEDIKEIIVVDDNSPDGTAARVIALSQEFPHVHLISRARKLGLGSAYAAGMQLALGNGAEAVVTMDADLSHDPRAIPALIKGLDDHDLMIGSRYIEGGKIEEWGSFRRLLSRSANFLARILLGIKARDCTAGFRCYRRSVLERIKPHSIKSHGYSYLEEMIYYVARSGFRIGEIPITFRDRRAGKSKISKAEIGRGVLTLFRLFFLRPKK